MLLETMQRRTFLKSLLAAFFGSAVIHKATMAEVNPSWLTTRPLPPSNFTAINWWSQVGDEALRILEGELRILKIVGCDERAELGRSIYIREPLRFILPEEPDWGRIDQILQRCHHAQMDTMVGTDLDLEDYQRFTLAQFSERMLQPAMISLANQIFKRARSAELLVTAPLILPITGYGIPAATMSSGERLNLRTLTYRRRIDEPLRLRFDMLCGTVGR